MTLCRCTRIVLLDAPVGVRRSYHVALHRLTQIQWLADNAATAANLCEEVGIVDVDTPGFYTSVKTPRHAVMVDGVQRLSLRQQTDLLRRLAKNPPRLILLAGDSAGRVLGPRPSVGRGPPPYHRALDGWTLCCHTLRLLREGQGVQASTTTSPDSAVEQILRDGGAGLDGWVQSPEMQVPEWKPCDTMGEEVSGGGGGAGEPHRWIRAPVPNQHLVSWPARGLDDTTRWQGGRVCQSVPMPRSTMLVVNNRQHAGGLTDPITHFGPPLPIQAGVRAVVRRAHTGLRRGPSDCATNRSPTRDRRSGA